MKNLIIYIIIATSLSIAGCEDLEIKNPNQPSVEEYWKNEAHAEEGVNAIYSTLPRTGITRWMPFLYILRSDVGRSLSPAAAIVNNTDRFLQTNYNAPHTREVWSDLYLGIFRANQVLMNVPEITMDENLKNRFLGEAYFLRGYFYFHLASLWGNVPLILEPSTLETFPATAARDQVWAQVEKDLELAEEMLPMIYDNPENLGRATKGAAKALLAKTHMQQQEYDKALEPLEWLVEGAGAGIYDLMPAYRDNFLRSTENNQESVFELQFEINPTENTGDDTQPNHNYGSSIAQFFAPSGIGWSDGEAHPWVIDEFLIEQTVAGERDPRLAATFLYENTDIRGPQFTMIYGKTFAERFPNGNNRVWFRKFLNDHWKNEEGYRSPNNWRVIRYADVLLMYAETLNALNRTPEAYVHVDRVRQRVGLPALSDIKPGMSQAEFLEQLKHERLLELAGEGQRWNDLARWGDLGPELADRDPGFNNFVIGKHELLPVPQRDIDYNPNLDQNPEW